MKSYVVDTNVFLADPLAIYAFPGSNVLIPDIVLSELDRLKTSKMDKRLRYRGRQISRILFGLSEHGMLLEGIPIEDGSQVRVVALDSSSDVPSTLNPKNSDDRILAVAYQQAQLGDDVTLVTNDLNMLLKAQTLDLRVVRYGEDDERGWGFRVVQAVKRNRAVAAAVVVGLVALALALYALSMSTARNTATQQPTSFPSQGGTTLPGIGNVQAREFELRQLVNQNPQNVQAWYDFASLEADVGKATGSRQRMDQAVQYYLHALQIQPNNSDIRTDLSITYFYLGAVDDAIREAKIAIRYSPNHSKAHYNLGVFYFRGKKDDVNAIREFELAIKTDKSGDVAAQARQMLQQIRVQERQGGR